MREITKNPKGGILKRAKGILILVFICLGLNINAQPAGSYSANFIYKVNNQIVTFTKTSQANQAGMFYSWSFGDGTSDTSGNWTTHTYAQNGNYYVCLTISNPSDSSIASFCDTVKVAGTNAASCHAQFSNVSSQGGSTYFFNTSSGNVINSQWDFGDGTILYDSLGGVYNTGGGDVSHTFTHTGTYNVCLTVSNDSASNSNSYCSTITVYVPCLANFTASDSTLDLYLYDLSAVSSNAVYYWDFGDGSTSNVHGSTVHNYSQTGTYNVCLTVSDSASNCSDSHCDSIVIGINPVGPVVCDASFSVMQDSTDMYNYTVYSYSSNGSNYMYFWDFGDGTSSTLQYPNHIYPGNGPYFLCSTVSDTMGNCSDTHCDSLYAGRSSGISLTIVAGVTGIAENNSEILSIDLFPNPASDNIIINYGKTLKSSTLEIYDVTGQLVKKEEIDQASTHSINISEFPNGLYILKISDGKNLGVKRFIKQ